MKKIIKALAAIHHRASRKSTIKGLYVLLSLLLLAVVVTAYDNPFVLLFSSLDILLCCLLLSELIKTTRYD